MVAIREAPPRGIRQSITPSRRMNSTAAWRRLSSTRTTTSSGSPAFRAAWRRQATMATLELTAEDEPRSMVAFPAFRQSPAASLVTFGRFS